jgi:hypothetical protein
MRETGTHLRSARRYMLELAGSMVLYAVVLLLAIRWIDANPESGWRWAVALIPLAPILLAALSIVRFFGRMDEFNRRKVTESLAFAFAASALLVLTVGFLQTSGLPPVSAWWIWVGMGAFWVIGSAITELRYR